MVCHLSTKFSKIFYSRLKKSFDTRFLQSFAIWTHVVLTANNGGNSHNSSVQ